MLDVREDFFSARKWTTKNPLESQAG